MDTWAGAEYGGRQWDFAWVRKTNIAIDRLESHKANLSEEADNHWTVSYTHLLFKCEAGIACILGTGSNSCFYDGKIVVKNVRAGGYILGDEGSGCLLYTSSP